MSRPRTSYLRGLQAARACGGRRRRDARVSGCRARGSIVCGAAPGFVTVLGDLTRIPQDAPYGIVIVCTGGATSPNAFPDDAGPPLHGTLTEQSPSSPNFTYTPNPGYVGTDSFIITPQDNLTHTTYFPQVLVTFLVGDHPPVCTGSTADPVLHGGSVSAPYTCTDADGDALAVSIVAQPTHGSATIAATSPTSGVVTYASSPTSSGPETVTIQAARKRPLGAVEHRHDRALRHGRGSDVLAADRDSAQTSSPVTFPRPPLPRR